MIIKLKIKDLNIMTGVGTAVISDLENTKSMPRIETLLRICEVLDISFSDLFDKSQQSPLRFDFCIKKYEKFNKIMLNLYKTLNFSTIKDELADFGNPYTKLYLEAEKDGDF